MESSVFRNELEKLKYKNVTVPVILSIAEKAYSNTEIQNLIPHFEKSLDEYVRIFIECNPVVEVNNSSISDFLLANQLIKKAISEDTEVIELYQKNIIERGALPFPILDEMALIVATAFLTGTFTEIAKFIINKLVEKKDKPIEQLRKALDLLLSNSILAALEEHGKGMTIKEISEETKMEPKDVGYFLAKYEDQGWAIKKTQDRKEIWEIKQNRADIIEALFNK